ncbi:Helix-turn-helix domain-containing protein [Glycomyces harbinensis]|uniref:Helix-turn-helix domain-containing protein n=2 Tax=Glycomyces harbinensis TaxID=58114 RepID=A0A1G6X993_9ACTN|nr:Helix-turn-helix domain-containing protein [Glycomyces harbinensis]
MARQGRIAIGKSQREVGINVDRSKDTILDWEKGTTDIPPSSIDALAEACGLSKETGGYMKEVARARKAGVPIEADMRFNAIFLALAEANAGYIFKADALLIPGPLQTRDYYYLVVSRTEPGATQEWLDGGWVYKDARAEMLEQRMKFAVRPRAHFLIGEAALLHILRISKELYQAVMAHLRRWARKPGVSIRILREPVPPRNGNFSIYTEGNIPLSCPPTVYTEIADSSWLINDPERIASYDGIRKLLWNLAIRIEDYQDDDWRYHLA